MTAELTFAIVTGASLVGLVRALSAPPAAGAGPRHRHGSQLVSRLRRWRRDWHALGYHHGLTPRQLGAQTAATALLGGLLALALTSMVVLALACAIIGALAPTLLLSQRRLAERQRQIADLDLAIRSMRQLLEAGAGLEAAIDDVAHHGPHSLRTAFLDASAAATTSGPRAGVEHLRRQLGADANGLCDALLVAVATSKRLLPEVLKRIEEHHRHQREIIEATLAMQYRFILQARTISLVPLAVLVMMRLSAPHLTRVFETPLGMALLLGLLSAVAAGYWLMLRVGRVRRPQEQRAMSAADGQPGSPV